MTRNSPGLRTERRRPLRALLLFAVLAQAFLGAFAGSARAGADAQAGAREGGFEIRRYAIEGNTLFPDDNVVEALAGFTGTGKTARDVEKARDALETFYHDRGYPTVLVNIPEQAVEAGTIRLQVIESRIGEVKVTGNRHVSAAKILASLPSLAPGAIIYLPKVQEDIGKINMSPDLKVSPGLAPSKEIGIVDVELKVEDRLPLHGSLEINNRSSHNTSALRLNAMLRYDNLWQRGHSVSFQYQTSPEKPNEVQVFSGSYVLPLPENSDRRLALYGVRSDSEVGFGEGFHTVGKGTIAGARYIVPLRGIGSYSHTFTAGIDYKDFKEITRLSGAADNTDAVPVSYLPLSLAYAAFFDDESGSTQISAGVNMAFRGAAMDLQEFEDKRFKGRGNYLYATLGIERTRKLPGGLGLFIKVDGQAASQPLISNEQFAAGGMESVRGYKESEALGDDAAHGAVELLGPDLARTAGLGERFRFTPYLFYDFAFLRVQDPLPGQDPHFHLQGAGGGVRGLIGRSVEYEADGAVALSDTAQTERYDARFHFKVKYQF
jgi:hemolysin activation/secretion protein